MQRTAQAIFVADKQVVEPVETRSHFPTRNRNKFEDIPTHCKGTNMHESINNLFHTITADNYELRRRLKGVI